MCRLAATDETAHTPPTGPVLDRHVTPGCAHPHPPAHPVNQLPLVHNDGRPGRFAVGNNGSNTAHCASVRSNRPVTAVVSTRSPVVSGSSWSMNRYRSTRSSSITDTPQPASPSCPLEPCGVRTHCADDLAGSGLTLRARRGRCLRRIDDVGHPEGGRFSGIGLAVAGADP
jgi:hypothetical protein